VSFSSTNENKAEEIVINERSQSLPQNQKEQSEENEQNKSDEKGKEKAEDDVSEIENKLEEISLSSDPQPSKPAEENKEENKDTNEPTSANTTSTDDNEVIYK